MTTHEGNKLAMYQSVLSLMKANGAKTATLPALAGVVGEFEGLLHRIAAKDSERGDKMTGLLQQRNAALDDLIERTVAVGSALTALAHARRDVTMKEKVKVRFSALRAMRPPEIEERARAIHAFAMENKAALADYGMTDAVLKGLASAGDTFHHSVEALGAGFAGKVGARLTMTDLFDETDALLKDSLDSLMKVMSRSEHQFYDEYQAARVIKDLGTRRRNQEVPAAAVPVAAK